MTIVVKHADARFYEAVHKAIEHAEAARTSVDKRGSSRHHYVCRQQIVESLDWSLPDDLAAFQDVLCYDLAMGGFSYLSEQVPTCTRLVVRLGGSAHGDFRPIHMRAEIVHVTPLSVDDVIWQKIGCRFVGRPALPTW